jgi:hypothetical protein
MRVGWSTKRRPRLASSAAPNACAHPFHRSVGWAAPKLRCLPKCPDANERYFLRDRLFFVRIAVIVLQTGAPSAGSYAQRNDRSLQYHQNLKGLPKKRKKDRNIAKLHIG